jgi:hypothetical protein
MVWVTRATWVALISLVLGGVGRVRAQTPAAAGGSGRSQTSQVSIGDAGWMLMQDGILFANVNHQGGPRGGDELTAPNWWMGMASRRAGTGRVTFNAMFSLDPATVGEDGYRELFQVGEALNGRPLIDRQHPHDFFMQLSAIWRVPMTGSTGFTIAGGPAGEPALGPVAFMHRPSAADNPTAPLTHHTFDSTHVAFGVITAAVDHGPFVLEGSLFNGREPDQHRWDFDFGRLDSVSGRLWFRPDDEWEFQVSSGHLVDPEELEPGHDVVRSTASASWTRKNGSAISALTAAIGVNDTDHGTRYGFLVEGARHVDPNTFYARVEGLQAETVLLQTGMVVDGPAADVKDLVSAVTLGGVRDVLYWKGFEGGIGADVTFYGVPDSLQATPTSPSLPPYGGHPVSFHLFFRLRPPVGSMGRMWNMRMSQPMAGHSMAGM